MADGAAAACGGAAAAAAGGGGGPRPHHHTTTTKMYVQQILYVSIHLNKEKLGTKQRTATAIYI